MPGNSSRQIFYNQSIISTCRWSIFVYPWTSSVSALVSPWSSGVFNNNSENWKKNIKILFYLLSQFYCRICFTLSHEDLFRSNHELHHLHLYSHQTPVMKKNVSRKVSKTSQEFFNGLSKSNKQAVKKSSTNKNSRNLKRAKKLMLALTMKANPFFKSTSNRLVYRRNVCSMSFRWTLDGIFPM